MIGGPVGAAIGLGLGGLVGGLSGGDEQEIPDFDAAERARIKERFAALKAAEPKRTKKSILEQLQQEFSRGHFSIVNILAKD